MAYRINDISGCVPETHPLYFLDANVWLNVLKQAGNQPLPSRQQRYVDFYEAVIACHHHPPALQKKLRHVPRLVMSSLLLSEIINAYMRQVAMPAFYAARGENPKAWEFKKHYRPTPDYAKRLKTLLSDLQALQSYLMFVPDDFSSATFGTLLTTLHATPQQADLNDFYYGQLARTHGLVVVTDDADFLFDEVTVLTANDRLLRAGRST